MGCRVCCASCQGALSPTQTGRWHPGRRPLYLRTGPEGRPFDPLRSNPCSLLPCLRAPRQQTHGREGGGQSAWWPVLHNLRCNGRIAAATGAAPNQNPATACRRSPRFVHAGFAPQCSAPRSASIPVGLTRPAPLLNRIKLPSLCRERHAYGSSSDRDCSVNDARRNHRAAQTQTPKGDHPPGRVAGCAGRSRGG